MCALFDGWAHWAIFLMSVCVCRSPGSRAFTPSSFALTAEKPAPSTTWCLASCCQRTSPTGCSSERCDLNSGNTLPAMKRHTIPKRLESVCVCVCCQGCSADATLPALSSPHRLPCCSISTTWHRSASPCLLSAITACSSATTGTRCQSICPEASWSPCPPTTPCSFTSPRSACTRCCKTD